VYLRRFIGFFVCVLASLAHADPAAFDLVGPRVQVHVQRAAKTLAIAEVPNLQAGDRLWIHPDLPDSQSVHYLMVVAFLRGATNPPPESWFTRAETWNKSVHEEGIFVVVPPEAEQAIILLAPETGGAFSALRTAVRGKPGAFVRAAQDLEQAGLDRARLEKYLDSMRETPPMDPAQLKARTTVLARSLNIRLDQQCFDKPTAQQVPCLTQNTDQLVLDDAHSQTMVATLTSSASADLINQISSTPTAKAGYYSPYVGSVIDLVRILGTTHTAQFQYIPALALPKEDDLNLRLNNPPSFRNPKSVLVIALPPIRPSPVPPLRAVDPAEVFCADKPSLILPADGAPLVFATELAHAFVLHVDTKAGGMDLPAKPDAVAGGFLVNTKGMKSVNGDGEISGVLRGYWGFGSFEGPRFRIRTSHAAQWTVASKDASALIVGREDTIHLQSADVCCVSQVTVQNDAGKSVETQWKTSKANELEVKVALENASAGSVTMLVHKFGLREPDAIPLHTYAEAGRLDGFSIHAGDMDGILRGTRLDQVTGMEIKGVDFNPGTLARNNQEDELKFTTQDASAISKLQAGDSIVAHVLLKDGRSFDLTTSVELRRPRLAILTKNVVNENTTSTSLVHLGNADELPQDGQLDFFLKTQVPENFPPTEKVEIATADESFRALLSVKDGNLTMQDSKTVYAVFDPMKLLGPSAFGRLKLRAVSAEGVEGDWQPLTNLVRIPTLKGVSCPSESDKQCTLEGEKLFLINAVSTDPDFANAVTVPDGFVEPKLGIPAPKGKTIYLKLRDDPGTVDTAVLPLLNPQP
jgi:hypothetical protein